MRIIEVVASPFLGRYVSSVLGQTVDPFELAPKRSELFALGSIFRGDSRQQSRNDEQHRGEGVVPGRCVAGKRSNRAMRMARY